MVLKNRLCYAWNSINLAPGNNLISAFMPDSLLRIDQSGICGFVYGEKHKSLQVIVHVKM